MARHRKPRKKRAPNWDALWSLLISAGCNLLIQYYSD